MHRAGDVADREARRKFAGRFRVCDEARPQELRIVRVGQIIIGTLGEFVRQDGDGGEVLTQQGAPVEARSYLAAGGVDIDVGGQIIAQVGPGQFIGEMACMTSGAASATVRLNQPTRYFSAPSDALRRLVKRNPDIAPHLDLAFSGNIRSKLMATNTVLEKTMKARDSVPAAD